LNVDIKYYIYINKIYSIKIDDFVFHLAYHQTLPARSKTVPEIFSSMDRLKHDLDQAKRLAIALDREVGIDQLDGNGCEALHDKIDEFNNNEEFDEIKKVNCFEFFFFYFYLYLHIRISCIVDSLMRNG